MLITIGDIFQSKAQALVNTVNCVGVMGKGIALEFKKRYPQMFDEYVGLCNSGNVRPGKPYFYKDLYGNMILNFPTKDHWRSPSQLSYIVDGLDWFCAHYQEAGITSIAFPPLGCGNGGLTWEVVGPVMYSKLKNIPIDIEVYAPYGTKAEQLTVQFLDRPIELPKKDIKGTKSLQFNKYWLLILYVVQKLNRDMYSLAVGRTIFQKVCYILTRVGIPTGFKFVEGTYGPYAKEIKSTITALSNANYMTEHKLGKMVETVVNPKFVLPSDLFKKEEIQLADKAFDLLCRIKNTDQAEMISTVLFAYDELAHDQCPSEQQIFDRIMKWKSRWKNNKDQEIISTICDLSVLGWITPRQDEGVLSDSDDLLC